MFKIKSLLRETLNFIVEKIIDVQLKYLDGEEEESESWNIWIINTRGQIGLIAAKDSYTEIFPTDGSFLGAILVKSGLTEKEARVKVAELSHGIDTDSEEPDPDLN